MTPKEALAKYGSTGKAAKALGMGKTTFREAIKRGAFGKAVVAKKETADNAPRPKARTLADFRGQYDKSYIVPAKIRDGIKTLGANGWEYEVEFARIAGVSLNDLGRVRDQFADHVVALSRDSRRAWAGSKKMADAMREMLQ